MRNEGFEVIHQRSAFKVGTDAVLLGAWANIRSAENVLDIGTGCGIIALMAAQRNNSARITGIELDKESAIEADRNFSNSGWSERLKVINIPIQEFTLKNEHLKFDHILSNPPFFNSGTLSNIETQKRARHTTSLSHKELIDCSKQLLTSNGKASFVLPVPEAEACILSAFKIGLFCNRKLYVQPRPDKPNDRLLFELSFIPSEIIEEKTLSIRYQKGNDYTEAYKNFNKAFYLNF